MIRALSYVLVVFCLAGCNNASQGASQSTEPQVYTHYIYQDTLGGQNLRIEAAQLKNDPHTAVYIQEVEQLGPSQVLENVGRADIPRPLLVGSGEAAPFLSGRYNREDWLRAAEAEQARSLSFTRAYAAFNTAYLAQGWCDEFNTSVHPGAGFSFGDLERSARVNEETDAWWMLFECRT